MMPWGKFETEGFWTYEGLSKGGWLSFTDGLIGSKVAMVGAGSEFSLRRS